MASSVYIFCLLIWIEGSWESSLDTFTLPEKTKQYSSVVPTNGSTLELDSAHTRFVKVEYVHPSSVRDVDFSFDIKPPENHGVLVTIHSLTLQKEVRGGESNECVEYIMFSSVESLNGSGNASACGTISENVEELVGTRSFIGEINDTVTVHAHFSNNELKSSNPNYDGMARNNSLFILDTTLYSDCSSDSYAEFECDPSVCIPEEYECDSNFNCGFSNLATASKDELSCQQIKRNSETEDTTTTTPSVTTTNRRVLRFNISSSYWPWNWNLKNQSDATTVPPKTTTRKPILIVHYYDDQHPFDENRDRIGWAQQLPFFTVVLIFLAVASLLFGTCSFLAKLNSRRYSNSQWLSRNSCPTPGMSDPYMVPGTERSVYFYAARDSMNPFSPSIPPSYHEQMAPPPSYSTLFKDGTPSPPIQEPSPPQQPSTGAQDFPHIPKES